MKKHCDALTGPRRQMVAALERGPAPPVPERRPPTDEERASISEMIAELFPHANPAARDEAVSQALAGDCFAKDEPNQGEPK